MNEQDLNQIIQSRSIPGQSFLSNVPTKPPQFTDYEEAQTYIFEYLTENNQQVVELISQGVPISILTTQFLTVGFGEDKWNPDLMLMLIEPTIYTMLFIAEVAGVEYVIDEDEESYSDVEAEMEGRSHFSKAVTKKTEEVEQSLDEGNVKEVIEDKMPSLLAKTEMQ